MYLECSECDIQEAEVIKQCEYEDSLSPLQFG